MAEPASSSSTNFFRRHHHHNFLFLLLLGVVLLLLHRADGATAPFTGPSTAVVATFESPHQGSYFNHLTVNTETQTLYVGAVNYLYSLYPDLSLWQTVKTGPTLDNPDCPPPMEQFQDCSETKKEMDSYNKALVVDYSQQRLIACSR